MVPLEHRSTPVHNPAPISGETYCQCLTEVAPLMDHPQSCLGTIARMPLFFLILPYNLPNTEKNHYIYIDSNIR